MWRVHVHEHECGLLFSRGRFSRCLPPGKHRLWRPWRDRVEKINRLDPRFVHPKLDMLLEDPAVRSQLEVVELKGSQRALIWRDGRLACAVGAGRHAFWKSPGSLAVELRDASELRLEHARLAEVIRHADACALFRVVNVAVGEGLLVSRNGQLVERLGPGSHVFWQSDGSVQWRLAALPEENVADGQRVARADTCAPKPCSKGSARV